MLLPRLKNDRIPELKLNKLQREMADQISRKVDAGTYQFEEILCPICDSGQKELIGQKDRYGLFFATNICAYCGLVYTSPRMTKESYHHFYNSEYRKLYVAKKTAVQSFFESQKRKGQRIYDFLNKHQLLSDAPLFVFEVGCGAGGILEFFREKGHAVKGIDLGEKYIAYGKRTFGLNPDVGVLSNCKMDKKPDVIIYSHVLEHILDLNDELQTIKENITEHTLIYIEVPGVKEIHKNYESNILRYFQNAHTFHFSLETLANLFAKNGFELIHGNQFVQAVFKYNKNTVIIQSDYSKTKEYILSIEEKKGSYSFTLMRIRKKATKLLLFVLDKTKTRGVVKSIKRWLT